MVLDRERFFQRLKLFYDAWKVNLYLFNIRQHSDENIHLKISQSPEPELDNNNTMPSVDCIMVVVGDDDDDALKNNKSMALHVSVLFSFH